MLEVITYFVDYPMASIREVGRRFGVPESTIRTWRNKECWAEEYARISEERKDIHLQIQQEQQEAYKEDLRKEIDDLKKIRDGVKTNAALFLKLTNAGLRELAFEKNTLKACGKAAQYNLNKHSDSAMKAAEAVVKLDEKIYQIDLLLEHFERQSRDNPDDYGVEDTEHFN